MGKPTGFLEFQRELNSERGMVAGGGRTSNPGKIRELKRGVARLLTLQNERKLGIAKSGKAEAKKETKKEEKR